MKGKRAQRGAVIPALAARTTPSGELESIEDPMTLVRLVTGALLTSVLAASMGAA